MKIYTRDDTEHDVKYVSYEEAKELNECLSLLQKAQCNAVIRRVEFIHGGMGPDTVLVTMITGQVLQIGLKGANLYETRERLESCAEPIGGLVFPQ